jgi:flavorubredoxin
MSAGHGTLPREIAPGVFWLSSCLEVHQNGRSVHNHNSCFLLTGAERTVLVDTGMPYDYAEIAAQVAKILNGRALDYVFPTHPEAPHMGNIGPLIAIYPDLRLVGDLRNYHLYFPGSEARFVTMAAGESLDLGGLDLKLIPAFVHDLPNSLWAYEQTHRILFVSDAYPYTHEHSAGECGLFAEELASTPNPEDTTLVIERALSWSRYVDADLVAEDIDACTALYPASMIAPAHGGVITNPEKIAAVFKAGLHQVRSAYA